MGKDLWPQGKYEKRTYRHLRSDHGWVSFHVQVKETDLWIKGTQDLTEETRGSIIRYRYQLEQYIAAHPDFFHSLVPLPDDEWAPPIVRSMLRAGLETAVGPMAAVAGAMAESIGKDLLAKSPEVMVENGGDLFIATLGEVTVGIFAGESPLSLRLALKVPGRKGGWGVCTSSGTVGPSLSFGRADAVCILSPSASLADAAATAVGNVVKTPADIERGMERAKQIRDVSGGVIIVGEKMGAWGEVVLTALSGPGNPAAQ